MDSVLRNAQKNLHGTENKELYKVAQNGTKISIELYHNEMIESIRYLYYYQGEQLSKEEKLKFFRQVRKV